MSKYNKSKLYFYMLNDKFFERDEVEWLQNQDNGYRIIVIYLKLIFKCINKNGILCRTIGDETEAYSTSDIAKLIGEPEDIVIDALEKLIKLKFIIQLEDDTYFIEDALDLTNQSVSARKKQLQRRGNNCPPYIEIDKDEEKDIELINNSIEKQLEVNLNDSSNLALNCAFRDYVERRFNRTLSIREVEDLEKLVELYSQQELKICIDEAVHRNKMSIGYLRGILENRDEWGTSEY